MKNQKYQYFKFDSRNIPFRLSDYYRYDFETETMNFYNPDSWLESKWGLSEVSYDTLLKSKYFKKITEEEFKLEMLL